MPTDEEWDEERQSLSYNNEYGAFASPLKLTLAGARLSKDDSINYVGTHSFYWSGSGMGYDSWLLSFSSTYATINHTSRS